MNKSSAASRTADELVFLPLGGSGEIGMNLNLYGYGPENDRQWIMVDLGVTFGDESIPGVDVVMPDPDIIELINRPLMLAERGPTRKRVLEKVVEYVDTFIYGIAA